MKGPTRNEETQQEQQHKTGLRHDYSKEIGKIKCKSLPCTYDEAKVSCKARKRKERQESISSICQERKVIRSNSEERPIQKKYYDNKNIRRVSSSEDFQKSDKNSINITFNDKSDKSNQRTTTTTTNDLVLSTLIYDDCEHEKRRSNERFAKPFTFKSNKKTSKNKKPKARYLSKSKFKSELSHDNSNLKEQKISSVQQQDENTEKIELLETKMEKFLLKTGTDKERSPSPVKNSFSEDFDITTLHQQVDCSEPLLSCSIQQIDEDTETLPGLSIASNRLLSSPRNSIIATHRIYLDPDVQQSNIDLSNKILENPLQQKLNKLSKQINGIKKKIKKFEMQFENNYGYKLSHVDKLSDKTIRKLYVELGKLRKEYKHFFDLSIIEPAVIDDKLINNSSSNARQLYETLTNIEKQLAEKRKTANRTSIIEDMTNEELIEEKLAVQKALLYLESVHGRPNEKEDRNVVRPMYDRYRNLKRLFNKVTMTNVGNELATIHEDETMNFITTFPPPVSEIDSEISSVMASTDSDTDTSIGENFNPLTREELIEEYNLISEKKKELRRTIKTYEADVQRKSGRMLQKEDKIPIENTYVAYKKVKAKLKLLDALVGKQK